MLERFTPLLVPPKDSHQLDPSLAYHLTDALLLLTSASNPSAALFAPLLCLPLPTSHHLSKPLYTQLSRLLPQSSPGYDVYTKHLDFGPCELARDLRGSEGGELEGIQLTMSQGPSLAVAYRVWGERVAQGMVEVCAQVIARQAQRRGEEEEDLEDNESSDKELAKGIAKIMEVLIGEREYRLKTSKIEPDAVYVDREYSQLISKQLVLKRLYKSFAFGVNTLLTFTDSYKLQSACMRLLLRFYDLFDARYRHILESSIITCLQSITLMEDTDKHETAA